MLNGNSQDQVFPDYYIDFAKKVCHLPNYDDDTDYWVRIPIPGNFFRVALPYESVRKKFPRVSEDYYQDVSWYKGELSVHRLSSIEDRVFEICKNLRYHEESYVLTLTRLCRDRHDELVREVPKRSIAIQAKKWDPETSSYLETSHRRTVKLDLGGASDPLGVEGGVFHITADEKLTSIEQLSIPGYSRQGYEVRMTLNITGITVGNFHMVNTKVLPSIISDCDLTFFCVDGVKWKGVVFKRCKIDFHVRWNKFVDCVFEDCIVVFTYLRSTNVKAKFIRTEVTYKQVDASQGERSSVNGKHMRKF